MFVASHLLQATKKIEAGIFIVLKFLQSLPLTTFRIVD